MRPPPPSGGSDVQACGQPFAYQEREHGSLRLDDRRGHAASRGSVRAPWLSPQEGAYEQQGEQALLRPPPHGESTRTPQPSNPTKTPHPPLPSPPYWTAHHWTPSLLTPPEFVILVPSVCLTLPYPQPSTSPPPISLSIHISLSRRVFFPSALSSAMPLASGQRVLHPPPLPSLLSYLYLRRC